MLNIPSTLDFNNSGIITWIKIREIRNEQLKATDSVVLPDVDVPNKNEWITYRQRLRDITSTYPSPETVVWPTPPQ
jgi:hypothetical protein